MSGRFTLKNPMGVVFLRWLSLALVFIMMAGCGDDDSKDETPTQPDVLDSGVAVSIHWQIPATPSSESDTVIGDCADAGVTSVTAHVYDGDNTVLASGGPWPCEDAIFEIHDVPPGTDRYVTVLGFDPDGEQIIYRGNTDAAIEVVAEKMTDTATIDAYVFIPSGLAADAVSGTQINLSWNDMARQEMGSISYRIYRNGEDIATADTPNYEDTGLTQGTEYCYTVATIDMHDNPSGPSDPSCAVPPALVDDEAPSIPTEITVNVVSASQIDLSWTAATDNVGVTGYQIYRNDEAVGTSETAAFSDTGLTSDTRYCYSVSAHDAADNASDPSPGEFCATTQPSSGWYRDEDEDGYGDPDQVTSAPEQPEGYVSDNTDCDDQVQEVNPGATEIPYNQLNDDCNHDTPDDDLDNDGYLNADECDDRDPDVNPQAEEIIDNGKDDDCNPDTPDSSLDIDNDRDGFTENDGDCRDQVPTIHPDAVEVCNEIDDNCNETVDEDCLVPIDVNIDQDFEYMESDYAPMGIHQGATAYADGLWDRPFELLSEPNYDFKYGSGNYTIKYGALKVGNAADQRISFAIIHITNRNQYEYIVDTNNDENLYREDYIKAQGFGTKAYATVSIDIRADSDEMITRQYRVLMENRIGNSVTFQSKCHHINQSFAIGDETFTALAVETYSYDGLYRENGLFIDLNGDEEIEYETEHFPDQSIITRNNVGYLLRLNYP